MDAIGTSALLSATYRRYLRSLLPVRDPALAAALADCIAASPLLGGSSCWTRRTSTTGPRPEEVGMLLRRLRERVGRGQDDATFQAIATSATVGDHPRAVTDFAAKLFDTRSSGWTASRRARTW